MQERIGYNKWGQYNISSWSDIVKISAGSLFAVGFKEDGTVVVVGDNEEGQCNVENWRAMSTISFPPLYLKTLCGI